MPKTHKILLSIFVLLSSSVGAEQIKIICNYLDTDETLIIDYNSTAERGYIKYDACDEVIAIDVEPTDIRMRCSLGGWENGQKTYHEINRYSGSIKTTTITMFGNNIVNRGKCEPLAERKF